MVAVKKKQPISVDVVVCVWGSGRGAGVVFRQICAVISCWQGDAKHRKHHLGSVSFSNHKRLKLHMCVCSNVPIKDGSLRQRDGVVEKSIYLGVCFSANLSNISTQKLGTQDDSNLSPVLVSEIRNSTEDKYVSRITWSCSLPTCNPEAVREYSPGARSILYR